MSSAAPPGYADPARDSSLHLAFPVGTCLFASAALLTAFYEVCVATPRAYSSLKEASYPGLLAGLSAALGYLAHWRRFTALDAATCFAATSVFSALSAHGLAFAFTHGAALPALALLVPALGGGLFGLAAAALVRDFGQDIADLGALAYLANPLRLAALGASWLGLLLTFPPLGILRRAALLSGLLAGASVLLPLLARLLAKRQSPPGALRRLSWLAPFAALASLLVCERSMPLALVQRHSGDVVGVLAGPRGEHVISRLQGGMLLFSDDVLASTSTDTARFAEALVHPAFSLSAQRGHVLVLDDGIGSVEREALAWSDVSKLWLVPHDPALSRLAQRNPWFRALGGESLDDPRIARIDDEAASFVLKSSLRFDVILLNPGDPSSYRSGKYFSRYWFRLLRDHLSPGGVLSIQITSPLRTPSAHASILETLRSAGFAVQPYRAALPTLGEWGFALAFVDQRPLEARLAEARPLPRGTRYVTDATLASFLSSNPGASPGVINHLFDQPLVELYRQEDQAFNE